MSDRWVQRQRESLSSFLSNSPGEAATSDRLCEHGVQFPSRSAHPDALEKGADCFFDCHFPCPSHHGGLQGRQRKEPNPPVPTAELPAPGPASGEATQQLP